MVPHHRRGQPGKMTVPHPKKDLPLPTACSILKCVFRPIMTARFGIVTAEFGNVTGRFGDVIGVISKAV